MWVMVVMIVDDLVGEDVCDCRDLDNDFYIFF